MQREVPLVIEQWLYFNSARVDAKLAAGYKKKLVDFGLRLLRN